MSERFDSLVEIVTTTVGAIAAGVYRRRAWIVSVALLATIGYYVYRHPPYATAGRGEVLVRTSTLDGTTAAYTDGVVLAVPGVHQVRVYSTRDQVYRSVESASASGAAPFQSSEGL